MSITKAVGRSKEKKVKKKVSGIRQYRVSYLLMTPYLLVFFTFTILPVIISLFLSFSDFNMIEIPRFIGLENYMRLFLEDTVFITAVRNTILLAVITGPISYLLSMLFAWFINELRPAIRSIVTLIFYAPAISGNMVFIWGIMFSGDS